MKRRGYHELTVRVVKRNSEILRRENDWGVRAALCRFLPTLAARGEGGKTDTDRRSDERGAPSRDR